MLDKCLLFQILIITFLSHSWKLSTHSHVTDVNRMYSNWLNDHIWFEHVTIPSSYQNGSSIYLLSIIYVSESSG